MFTGTTAWAVVFWYKGKLGYGALMDHCQARRLFMDDIPVPVDPGSIKFIPRLRSFIRQKGLAYSTEKTYVHWILYYIRFHRLKHPGEMGPREVD